MGGNTAAKHSAQATSRAARRGKKPFAVDAPSTPLKEVLECETALIDAHSPQSKGSNYLGLALSGGGIRSATFNLGVLQALAERKLMTRIDYLSTVSGGGYIGSWLSALIQRTMVEKKLSNKDALAEVQKDLDPGERARRKDADGNYVNNETDAVRFLRRFSNYLTPQTGLLSTDTLAGAATYLRNLLLTQAMIIGVFALILLAPRLLPWLAGCPVLKSPWVIIGALFVAAFFINLNLSRALIGGELVEEDGGKNGSKNARWKVWVRRWFCAKPAGTQAAGKDKPCTLWFVKQWAVVGFIVLPLVLAAWLSGHYLLSQPDPHLGPLVAKWLSRLGAESIAGWVCGSKLLAFFEIVLVFGLLWFLARVLVKRGIEPACIGKFDEKYTFYLETYLWLGLAIVAGVGLLWLVRSALGASEDPKVLQWHWLVWSVPALLGVFGISTVLLIGLVGRRFGEEEREWWSRLGAWIIAGALGWWIVCAAAIYGPYLVILAWGWIEGLSLAWIASTVGGVFLGKSQATGGKDTNRWLNHATEAAPYVFMAGLLLALSYGIHAGLIAWFSSDDILPPLLEAKPPFTDYAAVLSWTLDTRPTHWWPLLAIPALVLLAWRVDINLFSFHMFYRNRLVRAYLGASRQERNVHPFTGFDPEDNLSLAELPDRPFHIVNTAINLTKTNNLAWQERKAASFVLTKEYCGYYLPAAGPSEPETKGYQRTEDYLREDQQTVRGWLTLGQALTISGAAVSPNMGYHSSKAVAFLLTVFNVRLGWWMQNPAKQGAWSKAGPWFGLQYLLSEVFGAADETSDFVYLSDGGHFENLGIYELVRRKCRFIIAVDAGMDPDFGFEDLGNAVRKCQVDFGVRIDIDTKASVPLPGIGKSLYHCGVGRIHYEEGNEKGVSGYLLYIKPSLTGNEPVDITQYASMHPEFPHQTTTDQWFDESQFEAYRKLGHYIATTVLEKEVVERKADESKNDKGKNKNGNQQASTGNVGAGNTRTNAEKPLLDMFVDLGRRWYRPSAKVEAHFTKHAKRLTELQDIAREKKELSFLDRQIFPEWDFLMGVPNPTVESTLWIPKNRDQLRAGFFYCLNLLELMQDVYLDLNLDEEWQHPDNRGWINLFKHLSWAGMLRATYAVVHSNFGARFQRFCEVRLDLPGGTIEISDVRKFDRTAKIEKFTQELVLAGRINFHEAQLVHDFEEDWKKAHPNVNAFDELHVIRLLVPEMRRMNDRSNAELVFPVGLALTRNGKDGKGNSTGTIVFFRIQDHLRNAGLGREGLNELFKGGYTSLDIPEGTSDKARIEYLFYSIKGRRN